MNIILFQDGSNNVVGTNNIYNYPIEKVIGLFENSLKVEQKNSSLLEEKNSELKEQVLLLKNQNEELKKKIEELTK